MNEMKQWTQKAAAEGWAIGEFNISSLETVQAIVMAAEEAKSPAIIGTSMGTIRHLGFEYVRAITLEAKKQSAVPLFIHLDHGTEEMAHKCIDAGWDSVMIDDSERPYDVNVATTRRVVEHAREKNVLVEAQIGQTWDEEGERDVEQIDTDPAEVVPFVNETGVDLLAVSIGNTPGEAAQGEAPIKIETLEEISRLLDIPTVLHGGTSVNDDIVRKTISLGVAKVNIDTALRRAVAETLHKTYSSDGYPLDSRPIMAELRTAVKSAILNKIDLVGSRNRVA